MRRYRTGTQWCIWRWTHVELLTRLHIIKTPWFAICLHWIHKADEEPHLHDHPVSFVSIILRGGYYEWRRLAKLHRRRWFNFVRATDAHSISSVEPNTLTLCLMGPKVREWGYHTPEGWVCWKDYAPRKGSKPAGRRRCNSAPFTRARSEGCAQRSRA